MQTKRFSVKKKIKKVEKQGKKTRGASVKRAAKAVQPAKTEPKTELKIEPKVEQRREQRVIIVHGMKSECPSERHMNGRDFSYNQNELDLRELSQMSAYGIENQPDRQMSVDDQKYQVWDFDQLNENDDLLVVPHSQTIGNRGRNSHEITEEEGTVSIFQPKFRKVSRLDSPKMSISSSIKGNSLHNYRNFDQLPPFPQTQPGHETLAKMQKFLNYPSRQSYGLNFVQTGPTVDQPRLSPLLVPEETEKSLASEIICVLPNKSSSRRPFKKSRKNSSVENLKI